MAKKKSDDSNDIENSDNSTGSEGKEAKKALDLTDLPGIGDSTIKKLKEAGIISIRALAITPISKLTEEAGLGEKTAEKIIKSAQDVEKMGFLSADAIWEKRKVLKRISSGSNNLDELLGGGFETGAVTELFGEYRTGKTQVAHQLCVNVQLKQESGGLEGNALYIDTEGTFRPERIIQMSEAKDLDYHQVLKNITVGRAYNSDHQILLVKEAPKIIEERKIKLVVEDSLISHFRSEYIGRGTLASRQQILNRHIHDLIRLTEMFDDLCIIVTNQVSAKPDVFYGNPITHTGGNIVGHGTTIRIYLRKGKGEQRVAKIVDAPNLPEEEAVFSIKEEGITD